jgi:hypothetical protein
MDSNNPQYLGNGEKLNNPNQLLSLLIIMPILLVIAISLMCYLFWGFAQNDVWYEGYSSPPVYIIYLQLFLFFCPVPILLIVSLALFVIFGYRDYRKHGNFRHMIPYVLVIIVSTLVFLGCYGVMAIGLFGM